MRPLLTLALTLFAGAAGAADPPAESRARAALALAKAKAGPAAAARAPAPRPVPVTWGEAKAQAESEGKPLVVYVGCPVPKDDRIPGAISVSVTTWADYDPHTMVVCHIFGGNVHPDATLPCKAPPDEVRAALKKAAAKLPAKPKAGRLDWS